MARVLLPPLSEAKCNGTVWQRTGQSASPIIDEAGHVELLIEAVEVEYTGEYCTAPEGETTYLRQRMLLASLTDAGELTTRLLHERTYEDVVGATGWVIPEQVLPDGLGGLLV